MSEASGNIPAALVQLNAALSLDSCHVPSLVRLSALTLALADVESDEASPAGLVHRAEGYALRALRADADNAAAW